MGDEILCAEAWDKAVEKLVSYPISGNKNDILKIVNKKIEIAHIFLAVGIDLSYEETPTTEFVLCTPKPQ